jgi:uncharacterized protein (DUF169 family)
MPATKRDYSALDRFHFERKPIGVKYLPTRPKDIRRLEKALNFCEMIKEAQESEPFYVAPDNWHCVEPHLLGFEDFPSIYNSGLFGGDEGLFQEPRANRQMYYDLPQLVKGSVQYVAFAPADKMTFDPDVLVITATMQQAPTVLRALNYSTGEPMTSKTTPVVACSWIMIYPMISGEMNYVVTGLGLGMDAMDMFPAGLFLISIPFQKLGTALENLAAMPYREGPRPPRPGGDAHRARVEVFKEELRRKWAE